MRPRFGRTDAMAVNRRAGQKSDSVAIRDRSEGAATRSQWLRTREALDNVLSCYSRLLLSVGDPGARAVGKWTIGDVAAHIRAIALLDSLWATEGTAPPEMAALFARSGTVTIDRLGDYNDEFVRRE